LVFGWDILAVKACKQL